jgi:hypothetical protein
MPFKIESDVKLNIDKEAFQEDFNSMMEEMVLDRMFDFEDSFGDLHEQFALVIDDMLNLENQSKAMVTGVSASFGLLTSTIGAVGVAWEEMLLTGELSWKSFGEAMKAMIAAELAAISASALVNAIYATAIGFLRLAMWDFSGAANAFVAAATFAAVAAIAGAGALALAPKGGVGGEGGYDEYGPGDRQTDAIERQNNQRYMNLTIQGNVIGQERWIREEFIPQLNSLVMEDDAVVITSNRNNTARNVR